MKDITGTIRVIAKPNPFKDEVLEAVCGSGLSLREIIGCDTNNFVVSLNGELIPSDDWALTFTNDDDLVLIQKLPLGGDGKDVLRIVAAILVLIFAYWAAPWLAAALPGSEAFWASATMFLGFVTIGLLLPPTLGDLDTSAAKRLNSITGTRNNFLPFGIIPNVYGKHRLYPPIATMPVTEVIGEDQYLNMIYCIGLGEYNINAADIKIGDTVATSYEDVDISVTDQPENLDIFELQLSLVLNQDTDNPGDTFTRATASNTEAISVDFVIPAGLIHTDPDDGDQQYVRIHFQVEYRIAGSADPWVSITGSDIGIPTRGRRQILSVNADDWPTPDTTSYGAISQSTADVSWLMVQARSRDAFRVGLKWNTPTANSWDVRVTRQRTQLDTRTFIDSTDPTWEEYSAIFTWTALRSYKPTLAILTNALQATYLVLRIRATDQLNGIVDTLNIIAERKLRSWNKVGQSFDPVAVTRNPAWAFLDILTGLGNARPIESGDEANKIVLDDIADWATETTSNSLFYDEVIDYSTSVFDALTLTAGVGRAAISNRDGKWTVILEKSSGNVIQHFTPRNSWGFTSTKRFVDYPHAFKVRYTSEDADYQEDEIIVYDDGFNIGNATLFEVLQLQGITNTDQAWKTARYTMASIRLRPEIFSFNADIEHVVAQRGDHILMAHDIPLWGTTFGRIIDISGNTVTIDNDAIIDGGTSYVMRVRIDDNTSVVEDLTLQSGSNIVSHTFTPSIPVGIKVGDLAIVGEIGSETQELVIVAIEPGQDLTAIISAIEHNDAILTADTGTIPTYTPNITLPIDPTQIRPVSPFNITANSNPQIFNIDGAGTLIPRIMVTWDLVSSAAQQWPDLGMDLRWREYDIAEDDLGTWSYINSFNAAQASISIENVAINSEYEIQLRTVTPFNVPSAWSLAVLHTVGGETRLPPAIDSLTVTGRNGGISVDIDITTVNIRVGAYIELVYGTVNDRDDVGAIYETFPIPSNSFSTDIVFKFIPFEDVTTRYFWARLVDIYLNQSTWVPVSATAGQSATPLEGVAVSYYIKPVTGTAIKNGTGTLTIEAHKITGSVDILLSTGTIQLFDPSNDILTVANGYQTGSDGYTGILDSTNINGDIIITMKDGAGGTVLDTITLVDIDDGLDGIDTVNGFIEPENGLAWRREGVDGDWTPSQLTTDLDVTFVQGGTDVARQGYRLTLNSTDGTITGAVTTHPLGDLNTSRITITPTGLGTSSFSVKFDYLLVSDTASVSETVIAVTGGGTGQPGPFTITNYDDLDTTTLAAGPSRYAMLTARGTNTSGSQNNFHLTDAILLNKKDVSDLNFALLYSDLRIGDTITYKISSTRWFLFVIDQVYDIVGTGTAEAYKFGIQLVDSVDPDPTVNIPTAAGTDVEFSIHRSIYDTQLQVIVDPDFDLSDSLGDDTTRKLWNATTADSVTSGIADGTSTITFQAGTGPNGSNTVRFFKDNLTSGSPPRTSEGNFWHGHRIRTNIPSFDMKIRWRNNGANDFTLLVWRMLGYSSPIGGTVNAQANSTLQTFAVTGTTWQESTIHVESVGDVDAQYWEFKVNWFDQSPTTEEEIEIDSIFISATPQTFGTTTGDSKVQPGIVPESDTTANAGQFLKADGTWDDPPGGSASDSFKNHQIVGLDSGYTWVEAPVITAISSTDTIDWVEGLAIDIDGDNSIKAIRISIVPSEIDHDALLNSINQEHIRWDLTGAEDIHVDRISETAVTQHEAALTILESQITDANILARIAGNDVITGAWTFNGLLSIDAGGVFNGIATNPVKMLSGTVGFEWVIIGTRLQLQRSGAGTETSLRFNPATHTEVITSVGGSFRILDASGSDNMQFYHTGIDAIIGFFQTIDLELGQGLSGAVKLFSPMEILASVAGAAGFNIPEGVAPTSPVDGDIWVTTTDIIARINGVSESLLSSSSGTVTDVNSGNGMDFTDFTVTGTVILGLPSTLTGSTTNAVTASSHTHAITTSGSGNIVAQVSPSFTTKITTDPIFINESIGASADVTADGQIWVRNTVPNNLYYTGDTGIDYPVGYGTYRKTAVNTLDHKDNSETIGEQHIGGVWHKTTTTARTLTLETSSGTNFPVGAQLAIYNRSTSGNMTINDTSTQTLWLLDGSTAVDSVGGVTIGPGGYATLIRESTTVSVIMGAGITL